MPCLNTLKILFFTLIIKLLIKFNFFFYDNVSNTYFNEIISPFLYKIKLDSHEKFFELKFNLNRLNRNILI